MSSSATISVPLALDASLTDWAMVSQPGPASVLNAPPTRRISMPPMVAVMGPVAVCRSAGRSAVASVW